MRLNKSSVAATNEAAVKTSFAFGISIIANRSSSFRWDEYVRASAEANTIYVMASLKALSSLMSQYSQCDYEMSSWDPTYSHHDQHYDFSLGISTRT